MNTVKGKVENGKILVLEPVDEFEGREVTIMLDEDLNDKSNGIGNDASKTEIRAGWEQFMKTVKENQIESEITDMAHQHDHRLYGFPRPGQRVRPSNTEKSDMLGEWKTKILIFASHSHLPL